MTTLLPSAPSSPALGGASRTKRLLLVGGLLTAGAVAGAAARRMSARAERRREMDAVDEELLALGWGDGLERPEHRIVRTRDGAELAVWDLDGVAGPEAPVVVLPHCWGCSHEIWLPVARRLRDEGCRVVLYDQRGHGLSTRGTAALTVETLAHDLETVLESTDVRDAVLAGHSMGGMTIMSLATHRPHVLRDRAKAAVLVATAASQGRAFPARGVNVARSVVASPLVSRAMTAPNGHIFVRGVFGTRAVRAHLDLTRELFGNCDGTVRGEWMAALATIDVVEGLGAIEVPTTVMVGSRDTLTAPARAEQIVSSIPGARLVTLEDRGHMLPLEDPDAVKDEIVRAVKG